MLLKHLLDYYVVKVVLLDLFPSIASLFLRQFVQRNGPSHDFDAGDKNGPEFTVKPSPRGCSTWQTAQWKIPESILNGKSLPSLHIKK